MQTRFFMVISHMLVWESHVTTWKSTHIRPLFKVHCLHMLVKICFLHTNRKKKLTKKKMMLGEHEMVRWSGLNTIRNRAVDFKTFVNLTVENVCWQPLKWHLILSVEPLTGSWVRRCLLMFFLSCFVPQISQLMYWWQDCMWALRHFLLEKCFIQPGSIHIASIESRLTALERMIIRDCK